jgi:hypothetical protein
VIERKYDQRQLGEGFIRDSIDDCWEPWMKVADEILDDEELIEFERHTGTGTAILEGFALAE